MEPFVVRFSLSRRQRLAAELMPWLPAAAATLGFGIGGAYLALNASVWFLVILAGPPLVYPGLFRFAFGLVFRPGRPVEVRVDGEWLEWVSGEERIRLPLDGFFQVFRADDVWTLLHLDGPALLIPVAALTTEQVEYLKGFARRAAAARA